MRTVGLLLLIILFPAFAHAAVVINEIMYDPSGIDGGNEWIELYNSGSSAVDLTKWTFNDGGSSTKHGFNVPPKNGGVGSIVIQSGGYVVVADNAATLTISYPGVSNIIDSVMSMSNPSAGVSVTITLVDDQGTAENTATYTGGSTADGGGDSLQFVDGVWIPAAPTPGAANANVSDTPADTSDSDSTPTDTSSDTSTTVTTTSSSSGGSSTTKTTYIPPPSALTLDAGINQDAVMEVPLHLSARAVIKGGAVDPSAQIVWGFGDGSSAEGTAVEKTYRYAGTYLVVVTATDGQATGRDEFIVTVRPAQVRILEIPDTGIMVINDTNERLDLSSWALFADKSSFRVPDGTVLLPKANVLFSSTITKLPTAPEVTFVYPNGGIAARYAVPVSPVEAVDTQLSPRTTSYEQVQTVESIISAKQDIQVHENTAVSAPAVANELAAAGAALPPTEAVPASTTRTAGIFKSPWALSFLGVVVLAGSAFIFL